MDPWQEAVSTGCCHQSVALETAWMKILVPSAVNSGLPVSLGADPKGPFPLAAVLEPSPSGALSVCLSVCETDWLAGFLVGWLEVEISCK